MSDAVLCSKQAGHAAIVINRPEKRNALSIEGKDRFIEVLAKLRHEQDIRVLVITGAGEKSFIRWSNPGTPR